MTKRIDIWRPDDCAETAREKYLMWRCRQYQTMALVATAPWVAAVLVLIVWVLFK